MDARQPIQFADYGFPTAAKSEAIGVTPDTRPASWPPIKGLPSDVDPRHSLAIPSGPTKSLMDAVYNGL